MASQRDIRRRIQSSKNIAQITRAMQFVAASKLKRAQDATLAARPYSTKLEEVLADIATVLSGEDHEAKSSTMPYQDDYAFVGHGIPILYPASVGEFLTLGLHAVAISRYSGCWVALKVIHDKKILPGEVYYIEWGDYRMYKRLLAGDNEEEVIAHSDNITEMIGNRLKYAPFVIKIEDIKKLCLVKDIHKKHNH